MKSSKTLSQGVAAELRSTCLFFVVIDMFCVMKFEVNVRYYIL